MTTPFRGVVPILVTPFHLDGSIDEESLTSLINFNIDAGVHGIGVALGSEIFKFNEAEREQITRATVKAVNGRVPVIINSGANGTDLAVFYSKAAEAAGADALMVIPPSFMPVSSEEIFEYYRAIDAAVGIPIILQDVPQGPVSPALALRIADACPNVKYIKVETLPVTAKVQAMSDAVKGRLTIFGGAGGSYFIEEMRRGADGTMPFCSQPADFVAVWDAFQRGDEKAARARFDSTIMAINRLGNQGGDVFYHMHKQLLVRRGVIRHALVRGATTLPDPITQREIDELLAEIVPTPIAFGG
jgi:dihydrodipicolinate synthase/N-acetylneuraminate lyase